MSPKDLKVHQLTNSKELHAYKVLERARKRKRESTSAHLQTCIILQQPEDLYDGTMASSVAQGGSWMPCAPATSKRKVKGNESIDSR